MESRDKGKVRAESLDSEMSVTALPAGWRKRKLDVPNMKVKAVFV